MRLLFSNRALVPALGLLSTVIGCGGGAEPSINDRDETPVRAVSSELAVPAPKLLLTGAAIERLAARARGGDESWTALKKRCDDLTNATMHPPSGPAYPRYPDVGIGYQGDEYVEPTLSLGLCYRVASETDAAAARRYADAGERLLTAISTPESAGGFRVSTNSGYGIRHFGLAMSLGYDWLYPELSRATRDRVIASLNRFIDWYGESGFLRDDPIANYFIGYFQTKTFTALATERENPKAAAYWSDVRDRLWPDLVEPRFSDYMAGGGWPEGWGYAPRAVRGFVETLWGVKTAKGLDWIGDLSYVRDTGAYIAHFAWPSLDRMDDYGTVRANVTIAPSVGLLTCLARALDDMGDRGGPSVRAFANDVIRATGDTRHEWEAFLYSDPNDAVSRYDGGVLSHHAEGPGHVAARSSWDTDAVWVGFNAGRYINAPDSGEQTFNAGELSVVRGGDPVLVRAAGWIPHKGGRDGETFVYNDNFGGGGRRLYNTFFVDDSTNIYNPGQSYVPPDQSSATVSRYEDGGDWVRARGENLGDQYGHPSRGGRPVREFTRDLVFVRPSVTVLYDRTSVVAANADQWLSFHVPSAPARSTEDGQPEFGVSQGSTRGSIRMHLPRNVTARTVPLPGGVVRIEGHAPQRAADQTWLSVVAARDSSEPAPVQTRLSAEDGNVPSGNAVGVHVEGDEETVVLFPASQDAAATIDHVEYVVDSAAAGLHLLADMAPSANGYSVDARRSGNGLRVVVSRGGSFSPTPEGTLGFEVTTSGAVTPKSNAQPRATAAAVDPTTAAVDPTTAAVDPNAAPEPAPGPAVGPDPEGSNACVSGSSGNWQVAPFSPQSGQFVATFEATPSASSVDAAVGLSKGPASTWRDLAAIVRFNPNGTIDVRDGAAYRSDQTITYQAGVSYEVTVVIDVEAGQYSVFVTAPDGAAIGIAEGYGFRTEQAGATGLGAMVVAAEAGTLDVCDFAEQF